MKAYRRWLKAKLAYLDLLAGQELDGPDFDDIDAMVRQAGRRAAEAGLPEVVYLSRLSPGGLAPERAREYLAECLAATQSKTDTTLTPPQVAKRYGVSADTVRAWIASGQLKATKVGKRRHRISAEALAEFDQQHKPNIKLKQPAQRRGQPTKLIVKRFSA